MSAKPASEVEIARWETPFEYGDLSLVSLTFGNGAIRVFSKEEEIWYTWPPSAAEGEGDPLTIRLFNRHDSKVYDIRFEDVEVFRVLDEADLGNVWSAPGYTKRATLQVRYQHETTFERYKGWSLLIATDDHCVEIAPLGSYVVDVVGTAEKSN